MAQHDVVIYNETSTQLQEIQAGDTYRLPADVEIVGDVLCEDIEVSGTVDGRDVAADGALAASATQPGDDLSTLVNDIIASQAQAEAGSENTQLMTALRVAQAIVEQASAYIKHKFNAPVPPDNTNDNTEGYVVGSQWIDTTADEAYVCLDATTNIAVWDTHVHVSDLSAVAISNDSDDLDEGAVQLLLTPAERIAIAVSVHAYGILNANDVSVAESTVDATPRQVTAWSIDGLSFNTTPDHTSDDITIDIDGDYTVEVSVSFSGTSSKTYRLEIYKNGSPTGFACMRKLGTGGDVGDVSFSGFISLSTNDTVSVYQWSTDGGTAMTITDAQMKLERLGS